MLIGAVFLTALIAFCLRLSYIRGYKTGANRVLNAWRQTLDYAEEIENSQEKHPL
jgi:hypothetical protein